MLQAKTGGSAATTFTKPGDRLLAEPFHRDTAFLLKRKHITWQHRFCRNHWLSSRSWSYSKPLTIISIQDFTVDDENEMLEDLAALMGDDVVGGDGEGEWRSPYYSLGKRSEAEGRSKSKRFTVDFNGMQASQQRFFQTFAMSHFVSYSVEGPCADDVCKIFG